MRTVEIGILRMPQSRPTTGRGSTATRRGAAGKVEGVDVLRVIRLGGVEALGRQHLTLLVESTVGLAPPAHQCNSMTKYIYLKKIHDGK